MSDNKRPRDYRHILFEIFQIYLVKGIDEFSKNKNPFISTKATVMIAYDFPGLLKELKEALNNEKNI